MTDDQISPAVLAEALGVDVTSVNRWCREGLITAHRVPIGRSPWRIPRAEAERFAKAAGRSLP